MTTTDARKRLAERQATPADAGSTPDDRDALAAELVGYDCRLFGDRFDAAEAVLTSDWLAEHDRQVADHVKAEVRSLVDAHFVPDFNGVDWPGGDRHVQEFVARLIGLVRADRIEAGE